MQGQHGRSVRRVWTAEDEQMLRANWPTDSISTLAQTLNRSLIAVQDRVRLLGLTLPHRRKRMLNVHH